MCYNTVMQRTILHCDLNNFYASVEQLHRPELRGAPLAVCGDAEARHGVVLARNYAAAEYGVRTGDVIWEARSKCPSLTAVTADFAKYLRFSAIARSIYLDYTDFVEPFGIDEAWLDVSGGDGEAIADEIRRRVYAETGCTASVGVSWNKIYAKLAGEMKKPDATTVVTRDNYRQKVFPLAADKLLYVGKATARKLAKYSIFTIGELAGAGREFLRARLGKWGEYLQTFAAGEDVHGVMRYDECSAVKSVGNSITCVRDLVCVRDVQTVVTVLAESVAARLIETGMKADTVSLSVRLSDLTGSEKQLKIKASCCSRDLICGAMRLFERFENKFPVRSLGLKASGLQSACVPVQTDFIKSEQARQKEENLECAMCEIRNRFGHYSLRRGIEYLDRRLSDFNPKDDHTIHPVNYFR